MWKFNLACRTVEERIELALLLVDYGVKVIFDLSHRSIAILHQKNILAMLEASKRIGVTMTDSYMLTPTKSVTAVIGIGDREVNCNPNGCEECKKMDCTYRRS